MYGVINLMGQSAGTDPTDSQPKLSQMMGDPTSPVRPQLCPARRAVVPARPTETRGIDLACPGTYCSAGPGAEGAEGAEGAAEPRSPSQAKPSPQPAVLSMM